MYKDPLLPHITNRNCIFQGCPMYLPLDMTNGLSGYGVLIIQCSNTWRVYPCWWAWPCLVHSKVHGAQTLHYLFHSSQPLWPANLDIMLQEPPQRFPGPGFPRNTLWLMGTHSLVWRVLLPLPAVSRCQWHWFSAPFCHSPSAENLTPPIFLKWDNATY